MQNTDVRMCDKCHSAKAVYLLAALDLAMCAHDYNVAFPDGAPELWNPMEIEQVPVATFYAIDEKLVSKEVNKLELQLQGVQRWQRHPNKKMIYTQFTAQAKFREPCKKEF
jgi:hypothetical protein